MQGAATGLAIGLAACAAAGAVFFYTAQQRHSQTPAHQYTNQPIDHEHGDAHDHAEHKGHDVDPMGGGFPDLVGALQATDGCLGVDTAGTTSGKNVIFAWFEDKAAVVRWYKSEVHEGVASKFFPMRNGAHVPLSGVPDDSGPIMVVASITMAAESEIEMTKLPVSQIAIELYTPLSGGLALGGRFAPDSVDVDGLQYVKMPTRPGTPQ